MLLVTAFYVITNISIFKMKYLLCDHYHLHSMVVVGLSFICKKNGVSFLCCTRKDITQYIAKTLYTNSYLIHPSSFFISHQLHSIILVSTYHTEWYSIIHLTTFSGYTTLQTQSSTDKGVFYDLIRMLVKYDVAVVHVQF